MKISVRGSNVRLGCASSRASYEAAKARAESVARSVVPGWGTRKGDPARAGAAAEEGGAGAGAAAEDDDPPLCGTPHDPSSCHCKCETCAWERHVKGCYCFLLTALRAGPPFSWGLTSGGPPGGRSLAKDGTRADSAKDFCRLVFFCAV